MNPDPSKLRHEQIQREASELRQTGQQQSVLEFASVEELIQHDAKNTPVPPVIAERLSETIAREPKPARPWWRRFFFRG